MFYEKIHTGVQKNQEIDSGIPEKLARAEEVEKKLAFAFEEIERLQRDEQYSPEELRRMVEYLSKLDTQSSSQILNGIYAVIMRRFEHESVDTVAYEAAAFVWPRARIVKAKFMGNAAAQFHQIDGSFSVNAKEKDKIYPSVEELIFVLATEGRSKGNVILHHEYIHSHQFDVKGWRAFIVNRCVDLMNVIVLPAAFIGAWTWLYAPTYIAARLAYTLYFDRSNSNAIALLKEVQAYIGSWRLSARPFSLEKAEELFKDTRDEYKYIKNEDDARRWWTAYDDVRRLYALGVSDKAVGELVKHAKWDTKSKRFDTLQKEIHLLMKKEGYSEADLDNLCALQELERQRHLLSIRSIVQEEIAQACEEYGYKDAVARDKAGSNKKIPISR